LRWTEGIHYEKNPDGTCTCLKCQRTIKSSAGLGPHLKICWKAEETPTPIGEKPSEVEPLPTEEEALTTMLKEMGVKRAVPIAKMMAYSGWDNYSDLSTFLKLSGVSPDRIILCLESWSRHRGTRLPVDLIQGLQFQTSQVGSLPLGEKPLTRAEMLELLDERDKKRRKEEEILILKRRLDQMERGKSNPQSSEIQSLREEIKAMRQNEVLTRLERIERTNLITNNEKVMAIKEGSNVLRDFIKLLNPEYSRREKKEIEKGAREGIFEKVSPEYVAEE
jgi:hypothetical protein